MQAQARILFVDDEQNVLKALLRQWRKEFAVSVALGGREALEMIGREGPFAVIVSDMQMPGMNGAAFLRAARDAAPDSVRMLLTGFADMDSAISAVNEGNIFRFLCKPCEPDALHHALTDAIEQHRLIVSERELLEQTLRGSVRALVETLSLANPLAFGKAMRVQRVASALAGKFALQPAWPLEVAAMVSQLGAVILPTAVAERLARGQPLAPDERAMADRVPLVTQQLLANIPRLDPVLEILRGQAQDFDAPVADPSLPGPSLPPLGARILRVAFDYDTWENQGRAPVDALAMLRLHPHLYDPALLQALDEVYVGPRAGVPVVRQLAIADLQIGMVLIEDVRTESGMLLITRVNEITPGVLERFRSFERLGIQQPIGVVIPVKGA